MPTYVFEGQKCWLMKDPGGSVHSSLIIPKDGRWKYNDNPECPTFTPSMKETWGNEEVGQHCNHFNITDGKVIFHGDSTHERSGQTLDLTPFSEVELAYYRTCDY